MTDIPSRLQDALRDRYRLERELGEGGMATVYLADDLKHQRKVAVKVLKPQLAAVVGGERFLAEIRTTAKLQHPHILPLFDSGEADGFLFYVMPYVEGESLRERLDREKQLPVDEAVRIATDLAEALHAAHQRGVVHRDIKPANILLSNGRPLLADFGIALAVGAAGGNRLTETGLSVGTPFYMSPEQATGDASVGPASDMYALAAVLHEMLTGEPPYGGGSAQAVLSRIIQGEPVSARKLRKSVPQNVDDAIQKALENLPADRFPEIQAFGRALSDEGFRYGTPAGAMTAGGPGGWMRVAGVGLLLGAVGLLAGWALGRSGPAPAPRVINDVLTLGAALPGYDIFQGRVTADGSSIIMSVTDARAIRSLVVRGTNETSVQPIPGSAGAYAYAPSPEGDEVAFTGVAVGPLKVVSIPGGGSRELAARAQGLPVWSDTHIYFANPEFGVSRVPRSGGEVERVTPVTEDRTFRIPTDMLPGQNALLLTEAAAGGAQPRIVVLWLDTGETTFVTNGSYGVVVDGFLFYSSPTGNQITAAPFNVRSGELDGPELAVVTGAGGRRQFALGADFGVSPRGDLVYTVTGLSSGVLTTPTWVDRSGRASVIDPDWKISPVATLTSLELSHDGNRLAVASQEDDFEMDVWVKDLRSGPAQRLTFDPPINTRPFWSPDDEEIFYFRDPEGSYVQGNLMALPSDGSGRPREVLAGTGIGHGSWGPGHEWMIYRVGVPARVSRDIYALRPADGESVELVATSATEQGASLSPDGRWLLYQSDRSGDHNVYVRPFPDVDEALVQVSLAGGTEPRWSDSGEEIFYRDADGWMVSATVDAGAAFRITSRERLFDATAYWSDPAAPQYDVTPTGSASSCWSGSPGPIRWS